MVKSVIESTVNSVNSEDVLELFCALELFPGLDVPLPLNAMDTHGYEGVNPGASAPLNIKYPAKQGERYPSQFGIFSQYLS